jgi:NAD(P)-dependent dehydrogenase (short-subunit alcohol dehydrogenase family)
MIGQRRGKIIDIASVAGLRGAPRGFQAIGYHASKCGMITVMKDLARKWAIDKICANAIAHGWFPTGMSGVVIEPTKEPLRKSIPFDRFGNEHDGKGPAVFLASDALNFATGHVLVVDGGQFA